MSLLLLIALAHPAPAPPQDAALPAEPPVGAAPAPEPGPLRLGSTVWGDWDSDGLLDLYAIGRGRPDRLLGNRGDGTFADLTESLGLTPLAGARSARFADFDADGHVDLLRVSAEGTLVLDRNVEGVGFAPAGLEGGLGRGTVGLLAAEWIDYDRDGFLDLALLMRDHQELWRSRAGRAFERVPLPLDGDPATTPGGFGPLDQARRGDAASAVAGPPLVPGGAAAGPGTTSPASPLCLETIRDQATGGCVAASSAPLLGALYPLGPELNIDASGRVGIGTTTPGARLDVAGTVRADGLLLPLGAQPGYVLTSDAAGNASWQPDASPVGIGGGGTDGRIARFTGGAAVGDSVAFEQNGRLGVGTTSPQSGLHLRSGPLDIATGATGNLRVEGLAADGTGGTIEFGTPGIGPRSFLTQNGDKQLVVASDLGTVFTGDGSGEGNVAVKTAELTHSLNVGSSASSHALRVLGMDSFYAGGRISFGDGDYCLIEEETDDHLRIRSRLGVTIERDNVFDARTLSVYADGGGGSTNLAIFAKNASTADGQALGAEAWGTAAAAQINNRGTGSHLACSAGAGINVFEVKHSGRVVTTALEITGGGDLVESFEVAGDAPAPGTVMAIDPRNPGKLVPSSAAYDRRVAGAVSGAGGVSHGIQLGQRGVLEGDVLVAMAGRIYVRCTAANGAIEPGDRLTTADAPGVAMKATDAARASGAVLGKAMSALEAGEGLVLVLIDLQ